MELRVGLAALGIVALAGCASVHYASEADCRRVHTALGIHDGSGQMCGIEESTLRDPRYSQCMTYLMSQESPAYDAHVQCEQRAFWKKVEDPAARQCVQTARGFGHTASEAIYGCISAKPPEMLDAMRSHGYASCAAEAERYQYPASQCLAARFLDELADRKFHACLDLVAQVRPEKLGPYAACELRAGEGLYENAADAGFHDCVVSLAHSGADFLTASGTCNRLSASGRAQVPPCFSALQARYPASGPAVHDTLRLCQDDWVRAHFADAFSGCVDQVHDRLRAATPEALRFCATESARATYQTKTFASCFGTYDRIHFPRHEALWLCASNAAEARPDDHPEFLRCLSEHMKQVNPDGELTERPSGDRICWDKLPPA
jgi:hypothetical protein